MDFPAKQVSKRYALIAVFMGLCCIAILVKAAYIMTAEKKFWMAVNDRFIKEDDVVMPTRGNILADNGEVLAASLPEYKLFMDYMSWEKDPKRRNKEQHKRDSLLNCKADSISQGMHAIFPDIDPAEFKAHLLKGREKESHHWPLYPKRVTYIQYRQCKNLPIFRKSPNIGGFHTEEIKTRKNPYGLLAIRTIGDLYKGKDSARTGLELSFDSILRGKPGIAHRQKVLNRYLTIIDKPAEDGYDVMTTLNVGMQDICEKALNDKLTEIDANSGVVILMEVATGDIKAMTSLRKCADGKYREINADAVKNLYEPGSVFKPMSFLVGMDDGVVHMTDVVDVGCGIKEMYGRKMRDANWRSGGSGVVTVPQILQKSLNVGVSTLIDRAYHNNPRKFVEGIYRIGVAEDLKIPIPGYAKPRIRMPKEDGSNWSKTALPWMSIGYETQIPPITTVNFYNGIANNGKLLRPRLVKAILKNGEVVREYPVEVLREQMAKPQAVKDIQDCLESVVSVGLGKKAGSKYFHTSGKTGTAQVWTKNGFASQYLVSFAGYFPSEKPLYSCIVCIQKGAPASGGGMCAPVFKRVAETVMAQRRINDYTSARDTVHSKQPMVCSGNLQAAQNVLGNLGINSQSNALPESSLVWGTCQTTEQGVMLSATPETPQKVMPNVVGYGLRDAVFKLEKAGLKVRIRGVGSVSEQVPAAGQAIVPGREAVLTLGNAKDIPEAKKDTVKAARNEADEADNQTTDTSENTEEARTKKPENADENAENSASASHKTQPAKPSESGKKPSDSGNGKPSKPKKKETGNTPKEALPAGSKSSKTKAPQGT